jgi:hypothetical protein
MLITTAICMQVLMLVSLEGKQKRKRRTISKRGKNRQMIMQERM